jgi:mannose-6-phosphate isomerase-like protein (cupin superfamily)
LTVTYDERDFEIGPGDSMAFDPMVPHRIENRGKKPVHMVIALTPPSF